MPPVGLSSGRAVRSDWIACWPRAQRAGGWYVSSGFGAGRRVRLAGRRPRKSRGSHGETAAGRRAGTLWDRRVVRPPLLGNRIPGARCPAGWAEVTGSVATATGVIAGAVENGANTVGEVVADVVESAGNRAQDRLRRRRAKPEGASGTGPPAGAAAWLGGVVAGLANVTGAVVKGPAGLVGGALAGLVRVVGGLVGRDRGLAARGLVDVGSSTIGAVLVCLGTAVSMIQRVLGLQGRDRPLSAGEREMLRSVSLDSLALFNIRLIEGRSGVFGFNGRPFTLANTISGIGCRAAQPGQPATIGVLRPASALRAGEQGSRRHPVTPGGVVHPGPRGRRPPSRSKTETRSGGTGRDPRSRTCGG